MCRSTAGLERFFQGIGSRLIDQVLVLPNDCGSFRSPRFVARGEKTSADGDGTPMGESDDCSEPLSNAIQLLVLLLRSHIYSWIHVIFLSLFGRAFALEDLIMEGDGIDIAGGLRFARYSHRY
jgi:hypothetical protein